MKNTLLVFIFLLLGFTGIKAQLEIPTEVYDNFEFRFPDVTHKVWIENDNNEWQVEFDTEGERYYAVFADNGQWIVTGQYIEVDRLPSEITNSLNNKYKEYLVYKAIALESIDGKLYEIQLLTQGSKYNLVLYPDGEIRNEVHEGK